MTAKIFNFPLDIEYDHPGYLPYTYLNHPSNRLTFDQANKIGNTVTVTVSFMITVIFWSDHMDVA